MMDGIFILKVLNSLIWLGNGIIRVKLYIDRGDFVNILIAVLSFMSSVIFGLSAYCHFMGL